MKRTFCFVLALILLCLIPTVAFGEDDALDFNGFLEKYEKEDFAKMLDEPEAFLTDFSIACSEDEPDYSEWEINETFSSELASRYDLDVVLFNMPATVMATIFRDKENASYKDITFDVGSEENNFNVARAFCEELFKEYKDAAYISIEGEETDESELQELLSGGNADKKFACRWNVDGDVSINCGVTYFFFELDDFVSSSVTIAFQKNVIEAE